MKVIELPPGSTHREGLIVVDGEACAACGLTRGQLLGADQVQALRDGSVAEFKAATPPPSEPTAEPTSSSASIRSADAVPGSTKATNLATRPGSATYRRAHIVAGIVEVVSWLYLFASVIVGLAIALQTRINRDTLLDERPFVTDGVSVAVGGSFLALLVIMVAVYIRARTEDVAHSI